MAVGAIPKRIKRKKMKYLRYKENGAIIPAVKVLGEIYDISNLVKDINSSTLEELLNMDIDVKKLKKITKNIKYENFLSPLGYMGKIICIGLNYVSHAKESDMALPSEPVVFFKATSSLASPNCEVQIPKNSTKTDWEVELGVVIGKRAKYVSEAEAYDYIAGYTIINDISEREFQLERGGQWVKGKSHDTFSPVGPFILSKDELGANGAEDNLDMKLSVDGKLYQNANTKDMYFKVPFLVSYLSQFMTLEAGDIISTGTPQGVGLGQKPEVYLKNGQVMELEIEKLGKQKQVAKALK